MGKTALLLVCGTILLFLRTGKDLSDTSVVAYDNALDYYEGGVARNIAICGANMAANYIFLYPPLMNGNPWWTGYNSPIKMVNGVSSSGTFMVSVDSTSSVDPLTHEKRLTMICTSTYRDSTYRVRAILRPSSFSKFALYAGTSAAAVYWATGDSTLGGPVHVEGTLKTHGYPYFGGKVTTKNGVDSTSWGGHPIFMAGVENGVSVPINKDFSKLINAAASGGKTFTGPGDVYIKFHGDSVAYHQGAAAVPDTTVLASVFSNNGAVVLKNSTGVMHVQGTVKGQFTVGAVDTTGAGRGKVRIDNDILYNTDPRINGTSTDMLGIVAYDSIVIADNHVSAGTPNFNVMASLFSYSKTIAIENRDGRPLGILTTLGGWTVQDLDATTNSSITRGLSVRIIYDDRLRTRSPPFYPTTKTYEILAWYE
ncbi:MAG: hypothetical protein WB699_07625 [Bacteroidota bacterium]